MNTSRHRGRRILRLSAVVAAGALLLAACGTGGSSGSASDASRVTADGHITHLQLGAFAPNSNPQVNYNPFSATAIGAMWAVYDPLYVVNSYNCGYVPQLATNYEWKSPTELDLTTREGVVWNDKKPFTANDVAFTFNLMIKNPALDRNGIATGLVSAKATSDTNVVLTFDAPAYTKLDKILKQVIVPEHIWGSVKDPTKFTAPDAVGTGMYTVKSFSPQKFVLERNPLYWQADKVKVNELWFSADGESQVNQLRLSQGYYDAQYMYAPDIQKTYIDKDPKHNNYWFAPGSPISLYMNLTKAPFNDLAFRQALMYGMDKDTLVKKAGEGYTTVASQTTIVVPGMKDWLDPTIANQGIVKYDLDKASTMMTDAGYKLNSQGQRLNKDGSVMKFTFMTPQGWDDWTRAAKQVKTDFEKLGIDITIQTPQYDSMSEDRLNGNFDLTFGVRGGNCSMYQNFDEPLGSENTAPVGKAATTNEVRWEDSKTDQLLSELAASPDVDQQKPIVYQLENIMMDEVPYIPLWYGAQWFEFSTKNATNWPSQENPYAGVADNTLIFTSLKPAK